MTSLRYSKITAIAAARLNVERLADDLLNDFWKAHGHYGNIAELESYQQAKNMLLQSLNGSMVKSIAEHANGVISALEYGHYHTGTYKIIR